MFIRYFLPVLLGICTPAFADDQPGSASSGGMFQVLVILILVLGLMLAAAWLLKKFNATGVNTGSTVKIISGIAVGNRERIMVIEVADQWIVVGVTASNINALATMPRQEIPAQTETPNLSANFANRLKQFIDKRNGK
jgi:flagellar protein FliO/FliZ